MTLERSLQDSSDRREIERMDQTETVGIGEDFYLFPDGQLKTFWDVHPHFKRRINLVLDSVMPALPVDISLSIINENLKIHQYNNTQLQVPEGLVPIYITPLNPDKGYQIDEEDYAPNARLQKLIRYSESGHNSDEGVLILSANIPPRFLHEEEIIDTSRESGWLRDFPVKDELIDGIKSLGFQVDFSEASYILSANEIKFNEGKVEFSEARLVGKPNPVNLFGHSWIDSLVSPKLAVPDPRSLREAGVVGKFLFLPDQTERDQEELKRLE